MVKTFIATPTSNFRFHLRRAGELIGAVSVDGEHITTTQWDGTKMYREDHIKQAGLIVGKATEVTVNARQIDRSQTEVTISASGVSITPAT